MTQHLFLYLLFVFLGTAAGIFLCGRSGLDAKTDGWASIIVGIIGVALIVQALL